MSHTECSGGSRFNKRNPCALAHVQSQISPLKNPWFALRATKEKTARLGDNFIEKSASKSPNWSDFLNLLEPILTQSIKLNPDVSAGKPAASVPTKPKTL